MNENTVRLQKFLAERGVCSRRGATEILKGGRVSVNGSRVREPGLRVNPATDDIRLDGMTLKPPPPKHTTVVMNKPRGLICSRSSEQGKTVYSLLPESLHVLRPCGRLDKDSEGLVVLSDDGELIYRLTHPRYGHAKTYRVTVTGEVGEKALKILRSELTLDGYRIRAVQVDVIGPGENRGRTILRFVLHEGRNRQIRRMCAAAGLRVHRLLREAIGPYSVSGLKPGEWREVR